MGGYSGAPILGDMQRLEIKDLKRFGFIKPFSRFQGFVNWRFSETVTASINLTALLGERGGSLYFSYQSRGEPFAYSVSLITRESNLGKGFFWLFVCPVTGRACRKLYVYGGRFVSRSAIPGGMYASQTRSKYERELADYFAAEDPPPRYLKTHYRGKITPRYLRRLKQEERADRSMLWE